MTSCRLHYCPNLFLLVLTAAVFMAGCRKYNGVPKPVSANEQSGLPGSDNSYVAYYVINSTTVAPPHYMMATNVNNFVLSNNKDTSAFTLGFENESLISDNTHTNDWLICDSAYDVKGVDQFFFLCRWISDSSASLTNGRTYNLNEIRDDKTVPVTASNGAVTYSHMHQNLVLVTTLSTISGINYPQALNSYLTINKIEDHTASGTFSLAFNCTTNGSSSTTYANYVKGVFNKIPFTQ